ncbi:MAG TPA: hypothetical protein VEL47_01310, partial [Myxococcota bacterium]|nr:hypothetical protein [Myxococcota bacterium]
GFDANDDVEVIVTGDVPDSCHKRPMGQAKILDGKIVIDMTATKITGADVVCIKARIPYVVSVSLGQLGQGDYTVAINAGQKSEKTSMLFVDAAGSDSIDNFTYANVTNITKSSDNTKLFLEGAHPSSCMEIEEIQLIPNDTGDTIAVLPIVKQVTSSCDRMTKPFKIEIIVPNPQKQGVIYHVRRIDGRAVNFKW